MLLQAPGATSDSAASEDIATLRGPIQAALDRSGFELSFPKQLEDLFQRDTQAARCRYIATAALIGVIVYDLLAYSDYRLLPDVFNMALLVRFAFITPLVFVCVAIIGRHPPPVARETMAAVMVTLLSAGIVYLFAISRAPYAAHYQYSVILALLFGNVVIQLRFRYALVSSIVQVIVYAIGMTVSREIPPPVREIGVSMIVAAAFLTLFANWVLEHDARMAFLLSLRDRLFAADMERQNQRLQELSSSDPLTGVANRRAFEDRLRAIWKRAQVSGEEIGLFRVEVDHFKPYADAYGRIAADDCLCAVADCLRGAIRGTVDCLARAGDEEFIILLPGCPLEVCATIAERMRRGVTELKLAHGRNVDDVHVTLSIGVAAVKVGPSTPIGELVTAASEALARAKELGQDRVEVAPAPAAARVEPPSDAALGQAPKGTPA